MEANIDHEGTFVVFMDYGGDFLRAECGGCTVEPCAARITYAPAYPLILLYFQVS